MASSKELAAFKAVEVLELIGTTTARQVLQALADGAPGALVTTKRQVRIETLRRFRACWQDL